MRTSVLLIALTAWAAAGGAQFQQSEISASSEKQEGVAAQTTPALPAVVLAQIDVVAAKMVETIQSQHFSKVLVLGAKGPDKKSLQLGMMVGDAFSASLVCEAPEHRLHAATRKNMLLAFARAAALRLSTLADPEGPFASEG